MSGEEHAVKVLIPRQDMTGVDRAWAAQYETGDVVRYTKGSRSMGISPGAYAKVVSFDNEKNLLTVERGGGETLTYDPRRLQGVTVYRESDRAFSEGDRVQFTAPDKQHRLANRELGTIESIDERGDVAIKLDSGREVRFNLEENRHLDYGYAVTSHSSQGATADRVLVNVDTEEAHEKLINSRLAYVAVSRARYDAQIFTNDAGNLGKALSREVSHAAAVGVDTSVPVHDMRTLDGQMEISLLTERLLATLSSVFGCLATLLAALGLYGVMAFMVARRTREIGIRMESSPPTC